MMVEARSRAAKKNLREGIRKMESKITPAAQVRRDFRLGRPPKGDMQPLRRADVWQRATDALSDFRARMNAAHLKPNHAAAGIVFIESVDPDKPHFLAIEKQIGELSEECKQNAFDVLGRDDVIALGMIFEQMDENLGKKSIFPYQFMRLNERGINVLRQAAEYVLKLGELSKAVN